MLSESATILELHRENDSSDDPPEVKEQRANALLLLWPHTSGPLNILQTWLDAGVECVREGEKRERVKAALVLIAHILH